MAVATLADAIAELQARGYNRFSSARLTVWLNDAKNRFEDYQYDWPWLKTTLTGAAPLTVSDLRRVLSVVDTAQRVPLDQVDMDAIREFGGTDLTLAGAAQGWYLSSETVVSTYPVTASLSVRYTKFSPELTGSDPPLIPLRYRSTWVDLAEAQVLRYGAKDVQSAAALEVSAFARLREIAGVYAMQDQPVYMESIVTGASVDG